MKPQPVLGLVVALLIRSAITQQNVFFIRKYAEEEAKTKYAKKK